MALYQSLKLPLFTNPAKDAFYVLIYGASTATGALAVQYCKLSGLKVVATCSPRNFDYVRSLGADAVFDYASPTCAAEVKAYTNGSIKHALDCVSEHDSSRITIEAMNSQGGVYCNILGLENDTTDIINPLIECRWILGYTGVGEYFVIGDDEYIANPENEQFAKEFWQLSYGLLATGSLKPHRYSVNKFGEGFGGILAGLEAMRQGQISGEKLVYTLNQS